MLSTNIKLQDETLFQYLYRMRKLAMQGGVSDDLIIDYAICGTPDSVVNKSSLYGATFISDFMFKMESYMRMHERPVAESRNRAVTD